MVTPQLFVAAILLNVPIALSSLALDSRFTRLLVILALIADAVAGYANAVRDSHLIAIAVGDRVIVGLSFFLVGLLSIEAQRLARQAGELAERQDRAARERGIRRAVEIIRSSVNRELIERAVVGEAGRALAVDAAHLYLLEAGLDRTTTFSWTGGEVNVSAGRPSPEVLSFVQRVADARSIEIVRETDAFGRLLIDTLGAHYAIAGPLVEHDVLFGVLVVLRRESDFEPQFREGFALYVEQAAIALAQAGLFVQLADGNAGLARANEALRERNDIIRDIVYALSHDLRTPLTAAGMTMRQALSGAYGPLPEAYREILRRSLESNDELQRLAETLLLVSRYESGENSRVREHLAVRALAESVVVELAPLWRGKELEVVVDGDRNLEVMADPGELRRALINVVANAVTFTPSHGHIAVHVVAIDGRAALQVEDDGFGVPESERARLFERVREAPSRHGAGSGLGLYLARRVVESHGGSIEYAPRAGQGSVFTLMLPQLAGVAVQ
jgi:signal transduction histidine kinase